MAASNPPGSFFDIVPYSSLIPSHEEKREDPTGKPDPINPTIARLIKAVRDNPTPK